jgi:hypothetical protein
MKYKMISAPILLIRLKSKFHKLLVDQVGWSYNDLVTEGKTNQFMEHNVGLEIEAH